MFPISFEGQIMQGSDHAHRGGPGRDDAEGQEGAQGQGQACSKSHYTYVRSRSVASQDLDLLKQRSIILNNSGPGRVGVFGREAQDGAGDERDARPAAEREEGGLARHGGGGRGEEARHQPDQADGE